MIETTYSASTATREVTTPEIARVKREDHQEIDTTEGPDLQEGMIEEDLALQETIAGTIEMTVDTEIETITDLVMTEEEEIGEETDLEMTGIEEETTLETGEEAIEMPPGEGMTQEVDLNPEVELTPEADLIQEAEMIVTEEEAQDLEMKEKTTDLRAEILTDALKRNLLALTRVETKSLHTDRTMTIRFLRDVVHPHTEERLLITLTKSLRKLRIRSRMHRLRTQSMFEGEIFNQRMLLFYRKMCEMKA